MWDKQCCDLNGNDWSGGARDGRMNGTNEYQWCACAIEVCWIVFRRESRIEASVFEFRIIFNLFSKHFQVSGGTRHQVLCS